MEKQVYDTLIFTRIEIHEALKHNFKEAQKSNAQTDIRIIKARLEEIDKLYDEFRTNKREFNTCTSVLVDDTLKTFINENNKINEDYLLSKGILTSLLPPDANPQLNATHTPHEQAFKLNIRLPPINIKKFNGSFDQWEEFRDTFNSIVHQSDELTESQKLLYLKTSVEKEPFDLIKNLKATNNNFDIAWKLLEDRYQHNRKIFESHFNAIINIPQ